MMTRGHPCLHPYRIPNASLDGNHSLDGNQRSSPLSALDLLASLSNDSWLYEPQVRHEGAALIDALVLFQTTIATRLTVIKNLSTTFSEGYGIPFSMKAD
jgi:hypothetical protein